MSDIDFIIYKEGNKIISDFVEFLKKQEDYIQDHEHSWDFEVLWDNLVRERKKYEEILK